MLYTLHNIYIILLYTTVILYTTKCVCVYMYIYIYTHSEDGLV